VAYRHDLREIPLDIPPQICITKDNTQLQVDGILYYQVTDPKLASYGSSNYVLAITQLAQTMLRSVIGRMELDRTFEERDQINASIVSALDGRPRDVGREGAALRDQGPDAARGDPALDAGADHRRARKARGHRHVRRQRQEQINLAEGARSAAIAKSEGEKQAEVNVAQGQAGAILAIAEANAKAIRQVAEAIAEPGGIAAVNLKVAEQYIEQFGHLARNEQHADLPTNVADVAA
jgi:regulator of protease activity HflC (stomatin/prohibitin superfamily)